MKILKFLRSMKFGMILLVLIVICSLFGSLILQNQEPAYYEAKYPGFGGIITVLSLDDVFSSWYFIVLLILLGINLILCSVLRLKNNISAYSTCFEKTFSKECEPASGGVRDKIEALLKSKRFKVTEKDGEKVYYKNRLGYYGSFITHLGLLLVLAFAAGAMYLSVYNDQMILPGDSYTLEDGTTVAVDSFTIGEGAMPDYRSVLSITDKNGKESGSREISVNYPLSFGGHKFFQQSYGVTGYLTVTNEGESSSIALEYGMFITLDGTNGIRYEALYPDYETDEGGKITPVNAQDFVNPVYLISITEGGETTIGVVLPGTTLSVGDVMYTFEAPLYYPGIRIKTVPAIIMGLLYFSFGLLIVGLYLCFFHVPIFVKIGKKGYALNGPKHNFSLENDINSIRRV